MHSLKRLSLLLATSALAACATAPRLAVAPPPATVAEPVGPAEPAPLPALISEVAIPHQEFKLD
ncbi:MAG: hypothetical protein M3448_05165, partial [Pseudomonadota bacterium]|nr:hypothetical protein [Pseudomonadota bacterium]